MITAPLAFRVLERQRKESRDLIGFDLIKEVRESLTANTLQIFLVTDTGKTHPLASDDRAIDHPANIPIKPFIERERSNQSLPARCFR